MNKKQLRISLVVLGLFAMAVICIGLFSGTGGNEVADVNSSLIQKIDSLGSMSINEIHKFKDGTYRTQTSENILGFDKIGDILNIEYTGYMNPGKKQYIAIVKETKKYSDTTLYKVSTIEYISEPGIGTFDKFRTLEELKNAIKTGNISDGDLEIKEDILELKVFDSEVMLNDTMYSFLYKREREKMTPEELEEYNRNWEKETDKYRYIKDLDAIPEEITDSNNTDDTSSDAMNNEDSSTESTGGAVE